MAVKVIEHGATILETSSTVVGSAERRKVFWLQIILRFEGNVCSVPSCWDLNWMELIREHKEGLSVFSSTTVAH